MEWVTKGIRGAGSVVRKAYSFGRHSRQPFGDRPRYAADVTSPLYAIASRGSYCACYALLHRLALRTPTGAAPGALLHVAMQRLDHDTGAPVSPGLGNETRVPR